MEDRYLLARVFCNSEWTDAMKFVLIPPEAVTRAKQYADEITKMKEKGLSPYKISEFYYGGYWTERLPMIGRDLAEKIALVSGVETHLEFDMDEELGTVNTMEELIEWIEDNNDIRIDCECIECDVGDFYLSCQGKHCGTAMESEAHRYKNELKPMEQWIDFEEEFS